MVAARFFWTYWKKHEVMTVRKPNHIAIIPDGNRRWACEAGLQKRDGYDHGLTPGVACLRLAQQYGIGEVTYYGFTTDNCKRPKDQVQAFTDACVEAVRMVQRENVSLLVVGNYDSPMFPKELLPYVHERTVFGDGRTRVNFLVNYGWEWDLGDMQTGTRSRKTIWDNLRSRDVARVDLVLRWGGRKRLSGLLPVQTVYADIFTIDEMWPEFAAGQFERAMQWYDMQDVTLGG